MLIFISGCSLLEKNTNYPLSDHYNGKTFFNPWGINATKNLWDVIKWKMNSTASKWPENETIQENNEALLFDGNSNSLHITYIGHATTYIQNSKQSILTDPQFSDRASPVSFAGPKRFRKPALQIDDIPKLNVVIISHNHYDHLDLPTLKKLFQKFRPTFIVPLGNKKLLGDEGIQNVIELDWWQTHENIQLVPVSHWSARGIFDRNQTLWGGFVISLDQRKIFFAGDTGYGPHFKMIYEKLGAMDVSILPIGAYAPRWFMKDQHMDPTDALKAHEDLKSKQSFAIHFETFQLTDEAFLEPRQRLTEEMSKNKMTPSEFFIPKFGQTLIVK